jgi:hypothetical protein
MTGTCRRRMRWRSSEERDGWLVRTGMAGWSGRAWAYLNVIGHWLGGLEEEEEGAGGGGDFEVVGELELAGEVGDLAEGG